MDKIDEFKEFAKNNPSLANYIKNDSMTWQKFYELYDMYGDNEEVWKEYREVPKKNMTLNDMVNLAKNIDIDKLQSGVNSLSKAFGLFSDLLLSKSSNKTNTYKPRAIYKRFDD